MQKNLDTKAKLDAKGIWAQRRLDTIKGLYGWLSDLLILKGRCQIKAKVMRSVYRWESEQFERRYTIHRPNLT